MIRRPAKGPLHRIYATCTILSFQNLCKKQVIRDNLLRNSIRQTVPKQIKTVWFQTVIYRLYSAYYEHPVTKWKTIFKVIVILSKNTSIFNPIWWQTLVNYHIFYEYIRKLPHYRANSLPLERYNAQSKSSINNVFVDFYKKLC